MGNTIKLIMAIAFFVVLVVLGIAWEIGKVVAVWHFIFN